MGNPILRAGSAAVVATASGTSLTATHPSGSLPGDLILIWNASPDFGITWSVPGFNVVAPASGTGTSMSVQLLWKIDSGAEPASYTVTSSGATNAGLIICAYGNVNQVTPFDNGAYSGQLNATSTAIIPQTMDTQYPDTQLLWFATVEDPSGGGIPTITMPPGYANRVAQTTGTGPSTNVSVIMGDKIANTTGPHTAPGSSSQNQFNAALLLGVAVAQPGGNSLFPVRRSVATVHRRFGPRLRRGQSFTPPEPQAPLSVNYASTMRRSSQHKTPQWPKVITRTRLAQPPWGQGTQGQAFPVFVRRSTKQRPGVFFIRRGRFFAPVPPQGNQGVPFPLFTRRSIKQQAGVQFIRRGRFFAPGWGQSAQGIGWFGNARRRTGERTIYVAYRQVIKRRIFAPVPPQQPTGVPFPLFTRQASRPPLRRFATPRRRVHVFQYLIPKITWQVPVALSGTGTLTASAVITEVASAPLTGTGTMTVTAIRTVPAAAALSAAGTLSAVALVREVASASLSGTGTLTATASVTKLASASLTGTGTLTATGQDQPAARFSGTGILTATPAVTIQAAAALTGTGTLMVSGTAAPANQRITITGNAEASWETISEGRLMDIREAHVAESYVVTQDLEDGTFDP